jgi:hypothetical protein
MALIFNRSRVMVLPQTRHRAFSRWIADVFGDYALSNSVRDLEEDYAAGKGSSVLPDIAREIRARYDFSHEQS